MSETSARECSSWSSKKPGLYVLGEVVLLGTLTKTGSIHKVEDGYISLPSMNEPGVEAAMGDWLHEPECSVLSAGFFELKASEPLV